VLAKNHAASQPASQRREHLGRSEIGGCGGVVGVPSAEGNKNNNNKKKKRHV
jgi:hypothetical protein